MQLAQLNYEVFHMPLASSRIRESRGGIGVTCVPLPHIAGEGRTHALKFKYTTVIQSFIDCTNYYQIFKSN